MHAGETMHCQPCYKRLLVIFITLFPSDRKCMLLKRVTEIHNIAVSIFDDELFKYDIASATYHFTTLHLNQKGLLKTITIHEFSIK